ncbi:uncharacterized protein L969DRAFT_97051 [Mixia osmundae IAM 14324]|uniref:RNA polymerase II transcription factor B subunit 2 n=1 Tax=Mixia osmundae (strain CBS 9802 / IAM 14324 / JCM 22182 / KY 12970) TaxID=764103 RepID=G7E1I6_MIXOS|nr:uncharacterized protein L969DRAFT_97051 [Mixia osmundae IAM 14324]KEI36649.1 hypothetical protein L969DRAFT_97051 [Mixia osmundae IAM 14324]GAA96696.1 hypothetical protein E5Q_03367 [Mixia osmundae IAM 14324]
MDGVIVDRSTDEQALSGIYRYLDSLPESTLSRLYALPSSSLAVFRLLPSTAQHLIVNALWQEHDIPQQDLHTYTKRGEGRRQLDTAIAALQRLHIVQLIAGEPTGNTVFALSHIFRKSLRKALTGAGKDSSFGWFARSSRDENALSIPQLDEYATDQWDSLLHCLVGSERSQQPSKAVIDLLVAAGLLSSGDRDTRRITSLGFQFLLEDVNSQLWSLLLHYLKLSEDAGTDLKEVIALVFQIGNQELGRVYSSETLNPLQLHILKTFGGLGLVYVYKSGDYSPTRLAVTLTSGAPPLLKAGTAEEEQGFLILETNYRVYAYTQNPLQIAVLNLFVALKSRFPGLVVGMITRESIKAGLANGIKSDQIIAFLTAHAHPQMRKQEPLLPPTVVDQIKLWEREKNRVKTEPCFLYDDFRSQADYDLVCDYAKQIGAVLWLGEPGSRRFATTEDGHVQVRGFIQRRMAVTS